MAGDTDSLRAQAEEALKRRDWPEVLRALRAVDTTELTGAELGTLAEAEVAAGSEFDRIQAITELSHAAYVREGDMEGASWTALHITWAAFSNRQDDVGRAWEATLTRLMDGLPECRVHVLAPIALSYRSIPEGQIESTIAMMQQTQGLASKLGDPELEIWARQREAIATIRVGDFERGLQMLDETMVGAVSIDLSPRVRASLLCHGIFECQNVGDIKRAGSWIVAGDRATSAAGINFSGECHMHRAEILKTQGSLARAEAEARLGCEGYKFDNGHLGWGWMQVGEIRLRVGDLDGAEDAFTIAYSKDYLPDPGLAMLWMARGKVDRALKEIDRALEYVVPPHAGIEAIPISDPLRVGLLAAGVTIKVAASDLDGAAATCAELMELVEVFPSDSFLAAATCARGELLSAQGDRQEAERLLRDAVSQWVQIGAPYEASLARVHLADALVALDSVDDARMELKVAGMTLQELGAVVDEQRVMAKLGSLGGGAEDVSGGPRVDKVFMFTDIESSTALATAMGEDEWDRVLRWHDRLLGDCIVGNGGSIVKHEGDGVFAAFAEPSGSVDAAVAIQQRLAAHRKDHGFAPAVRIGVHAGQATERNGDYFGMAVNTAARVMSLASGGEIIASESLIDVCGERAGELRSVELKGLGEPTTVTTVSWRRQIRVALSVEEGRRELAGE